MKKKIVALLLMSSMMVAGLSGCGSRQIATATDSPVRDYLETHPTEVELSEDMYEPMSNGLTPIAIPSPRSIGGKSYSSEEVWVEGAEEEACYNIDMEDDFRNNESVFNTEEYKSLEANGFKSVALSPLSTFSADVDTASYSNVRRMIEMGYDIDDIPSGAVRTEEMINYFSYDYKLPKKGEPFAVTYELGDCPWNKNSELLSIGIKTDRIDFSDAAPSNIVFLIDVSGSMDEEDKLPLLVKSFKLMLEELGEKDRISIVTYASAEQIVLDGVPASKKNKINSALDELMAYGGTNGGQGIISAYKLAEENFIKGGNNRVILATDGDLNIGITNESDLKDLIEKERESGIYLTTLGFGAGNYSDTNMETLADCGNGNYAYIDSLSEAKKVLCEELGATMVTVAKDVKFQVEFNPAVVAQYRLIGYEDRLMNAEDFNDDSKDAGEIGAGHTVTALYEIVTVDQYKGEKNELKYQNTAPSKEAVNSNEWLTISIRYKDPDGDKSKLLSYPVSVSDYKEKNSQDFMFAAAVAEFSQIIRDEEYVEDCTLTDVLDLLSDLDLDDAYKASFKSLVKELRYN